MAHAHASEQPHIIRFSGLVVSAAQVRVQIAPGDASTTHTLCFDVALSTATHNLLHVEQPLPGLNHSQAHMAAQRISKGVQVQVDVPLQAVRLTANNTAHVHIIKSKPE